MDYQAFYTTDFENKKFTDEDEFEDWYEYVQENFEKLAETHSIQNLTFDLRAASVDRKFYITYYFNLTIHGVDFDSLTEQQRESQYCGYKANCLLGEYANDLDAIKKAAKETNLLESRAYKICKEDIENRAGIVLNYLLTYKFPINPKWLSTFGFTNQQPQSFTPAENILMMYYSQFFEERQILIDNSYMKVENGKLFWLKDDKCLAEYFGYQKSTDGNNHWKEIETAFNKKNLAQQFSNSQNSKKSSDYDDLLKIIQNYNKFI